MKHRGPVCHKCRREFYYDYLEKPNLRHERSGLCWECWSVDEIERLQDEVSYWKHKEK